MNYSTGNSFSIEPLQILKPPTGFLERSVADGIKMSMPPLR